MIQGVFRRILPMLGSKSSNNVAVPIVLRHITCPYCSSIFGVLTLGKISRKIDRNMITTINGRDDANPGFRETHLANPIKCPDCGGEFIVFVGVEYDQNYSEVKDVDVKIVTPNDPYVKQLSVWPHRGLVMRKVLEYSPHTVKIYESMDHFEQYNENAKDIAAASLININATHSLKNVHAGEEDKQWEPKIVDLSRNRG